MAENTGQVDKLIEQKVDRVIIDFAAKIRTQINEFLLENGDNSGDYMYQPIEWGVDRSGNAQVTELQWNRVTNISRGLIAGLNRSIKPSMIEKETKELLKKIALLS
tara:strand:- start:725 stop:1042 length:318 start_codon:yes stop_codon:yes gene_type:complete